MAANAPPSRPRRAGSATTSPPRRWPDEGLAPSGRPQHPSYRWVAAIFVLAALVLVVGGRGEEREFARVVERAEPWWLLAAMVLQVPTYFALAWLWDAVIRRAGESERRPTIGSLALLAVAELFTDQTLPSGGLSGTVLVVSSLRRRGTSPRASVAAVTTSLLGFYLAQLLAVLASIVILILRKQTIGLAHSFGVLALVVAVVSPLPAMFVLRGATAKLPRAVQSSRFVRAIRDAVADAPVDVVFSPGVLLRAAAARLAIVLLDAATLSVALASVGRPLPFDDVFAAFVLAFVAGSVTFLPGGLGSFEVIATALLVTFGAPLEAAAPATLLMRGFSFWLPMIPGFFVVRRELGRASQAGS